MFFQRILKGLADLDEAAARAILTDSGILSSWWRGAGAPNGAEIGRRLTWRNLDWHLNHYDELDDDDQPGGTTRPFGDHTPFISTTAGTVERDVGARANVIHSAFRTSLEFATRWYTTSGWVFRGYVYVLGRPSVALEAFAEEVRDLHVYTGYLPYQHEGEITAKLRVPAVCLERCDRYDGPTVRQQLDDDEDVTPARTIVNPRFAPPEAYVNLRDVLLD